MATFSGGIGENIVGINQGQDTVSVEMLPNIDLRYRQAGTHTSSGSMRVRRPTRMHQPEWASMETLDDLMKVFVQCLLIDFHRIAFPVFSFYA